MIPVLKLPENNDSGYKQNNNPLYSGVFHHGKPSFILLYVPIARISFCNRIPNPNKPTPTPYEHVSV